jgi:hypothetical protein
MTRPSPISIDDEVVSLARRYRKEAVASLVTVLRDESAPASARAQASAKLLEYSDGKPSQARQITVADLASMPDALREDLLNALLSHYMPSGHQALLRQACEDAVKQAGLSLRVGFVRGPKAQAAPADLAPPLTPPCDPISRDSSGHLGEAGACPGETPLAAVGPGFRGDGEQFNCALKSPNVVQLPGTRREPAVGLRYGTIDTLEQTHATAPNPHGGVHPDVVRRSALKDPLDPWRRQ